MQHVISEFPSILRSFNALFLSFFGIDISNLLFIKNLNENHLPCCVIKWFKDNTGDSLKRKTKNDFVANFIT